MTQKLLQQCLLFFILIGLSSTQAFAQPANDNCANATPLTLGTGSCTSPTVGTNVGATDSGVNHPLSCGWYQGGDVWFSFVAPAGGEVIIETSDINNQFIDTDMAIYGSCSLTAPQLFCDTDGGVGNFSKLNLTGLTPGATYYVAIWEYLNDRTGTFNVCAWIPASAPNNDDCINATPLTVNADLNCGSFVSGTINGATASTDAVSCSGSFGDDVWYSFMATQTTHQVTINNIVGSVIDLVYQLSTGSCGALTEIYCHDPPDVGFTANNLTVGQIYYLRIASFVATPETTTFDVCIGTIPSTPPSNDECTNAIPLPMGGGSCTSQYNVNNGGATTSQTVHTCANYQGGDIWFSFVAPASGQVSVRTSDDGNNRFADTGIAIYDSCPPSGPTSLLDCDSDSFLFFAESDLTGLTPGATYYIAVWDEFNDQIISFNICVFDPTGTNNCPPDFAFGSNGGLTGTISNTQDYETNGKIESTQILTGTARVDYDSQISVELQPGFEVRGGALFNAFINGCNGGAGGVN